jgi:hypothetical protein
VLVLARPAKPATQPPLFTTDRRNRIAAGVQVALVVWVTVGCVLLNVQMWHEVGGGSPKAELYGIWEVTDFVTDGTPRPPLTTDEKRWQRLVFDTPGAVTYQRMDGELVDAGAVAGPGTLTLTQQSGTDDIAPMATFTVDQPAPDRLLLDGRLDGRRATISLRRQPLDDFLLLTRGFHWVQEQPYFK